MTYQEFKHQKERTKKFAQLSERLEVIQQSISGIRRQDPAGPCHQGPFTGNTRESRRVLSLTISFSATRGGAAPVSTNISDLNISASDFGDFLTQQLNNEFETISKQMADL